MSIVSRTDTKKQRMNAFIHTYIFEYVNSSWTTTEKLEKIKKRRRNKRNKQYFHRNCIDNELATTHWTPWRTSVGITIKTINNHKIRSISDKMSENMKTASKWKYVHRYNRTMIETVIKLETKWLHWIGADDENKFCASMKIFWCIHYSVRALEYWDFIFRMQNGCRFDIFSFDSWSIVIPFIFQSDCTCGLPYAPKTEYTRWPTWARDLNVHINYKW